VNDNEYEYASFAELIEKSGEVKSQVTIKGRNSAGVVSLEVEGSAVWLYASTAEFELTWHRIKQFVAQKTPWYGRYASAWVWLWIAWTMMSGYLLFVDKQTQKIAAPYWYNVAAATAWLMFALSLLRWITGRGVVLAKRHSHKTFLARNADKIVMLFIGATITVLAQYLAKALGWR
jgi:hypothetical protein